MTDTEIPTIGRSSGGGRRRSRPGEPVIVDFDDWLNLPADGRLQLYAGIAMNILADPTVVGDEELALLSYGIFRDGEVHRLEAEGEEAKGLAELQELLRFDLLSQSLVERHNDPRAVEILGSMDTAEPERLQIPVTVATLVPAMVAGMGAAGVGAIGAGLSGTTGASIALKTTLSASTLWQGAVALASRIGGVLPSGVIAGLKTWVARGAAATAATGSVVLGARINEILNEPTESGPDATRDLDADVVRIAELAQNDDPAFWQKVEETSAIYRTGNIPTPSALTAQMGKQGLAFAPGAAEQAFGDYSPNLPPPSSDDVDPNLDNPYVGNYTDDYQVTVPQGRAFATGQPFEETGPITRGAMYRISDMEQIWGSLTPAGLIQMQNRMIEAGLIDPDAKLGGTRFIPGVRDVHTRHAFENLLVMANGQGLSWERMLIEAATIGRMNQEDATRPAFQRRSYLAPDPEEARQAAMDAVRSELGRDINEWEESLLVETWASANRRAFDASESARYQEYLAEGRAIEAEDAGTPLQETTPGTVQGVNPQAQWDAKFQEMFGKELDRRREVGRVSDLTGELMTGLSRGFGAFG